VRPRFDPAEYAGLNLKLKTFYRRKKKDFDVEAPDFYDRDLRTLFTDVSGERGEMPAARYLKSRHSTIRDAVARWTSEKKYAVDKLVGQLIERSKTLNLYVRKGDIVTDFHVAAYVTTLVDNHLFTGKFKRSK